MPTIPFHIELQKTGYVLVADQPLKAARLDGRYAYSFDAPAISYLRFFRVVNGQTYGIIDETQLSKFTVLANDGAYLAYIKGDDATCNAA